MEIFLHALWHTVKEAFLIIPVLYLAYILVSYFSHNDNEKYSKILHKTNKAGPVIGAFLGCIPQCGFSSVMSQLYSKKIVTLGTLIAVFVATSDEAIPIMITQPKFIPNLLILIAIKVLYAIIVGYIIDGIIKLFSKKKKVLNVITVEKTDNKEIEDVNKEVDDKDKNTSEATCKCENIEDCVRECMEENDKHCHSHHCHHADEKHHGHDHSHAHCCATNILLDALKHTMIIVAYVFTATLIINLIRGYCGGLEPLQKIFTNNVYIQILIASVIGFIPNCAASVFLVEMYMEGVLLFPALVAGLTAGAGVGALVLYTANYKKVGMNLFITMLQISLGVIIGIIVNFIPIW